MKRINISIALILLLFSYCKSEPRDKNDKRVESNTHTEYPNEVKRLALQKQFDDTKWYLYCMYCDQTLRFLPELKKEEQVYYGTLPLKFQRVLVFGDSVEINFFFQYKNEDVDQHLVRPAPDWGLVYLNGTDSVVMYSSFSDMPYYWLDSKIDRNKYSNDRHVKLLQPEVIKYIKENKDKLDPWFRKEAIKRGVISE